MNLQHGVAWKARSGNSCARTAIVALSAERHLSTAHGFSAERKKYGTSVLNGDCCRRRIATIVLEGLFLNRHVDDLVERLPLSNATRSHAFYRRAGFVLADRASLPAAYAFADRDSLIFQQSHAPL